VRTIQRMSFCVAALLMSTGMASAAEVRLLEPQAK
jgi:hypothetical protein